MPAVLSSKRLAAVRASGLLDASDAARDPFDRLVRLVPELLGVSVAVLSLVDADRLIVLSSCGTAVSDLPRTNAICARVVEADAPLVIADTRCDPELGPGAASVRSGAIAYVGVPLRDGAGEVLGSLCALERHPRAWTATEVSLLKELASVGTAELVMRSTAAAAGQAHRLMTAVMPPRSTRS